MTLTGLFLEKPSIEKYRKVEFPPFDVNENDSFKINVKIVQRKSNGKIVFAHGKEDFADFLISLLRIPLGGVVHLMEGFSCMYKSILNLDQNYWTADNVKNKLVDPGLVPQFLVSNKLFPIFGSKYFCCTEIKYSTFIYGAGTDPYLTACFLTPRHGKSVRGFTDVEFVDPILNRKNCKNIVKGPTMYMATDDLVVTPMTATSVISLLATMSIPFSDLEEKEFSIGIKEAVGILQASLTSKSALTTALCHLLTQIKQEN
ncbi:hypothetical protein LR48_Vigan10g128200 [Vigna angularis]|nr:uncharacterized protein LOC108344254 [Vigna angularis]KOM55390.1 hypothetical protein LR48_Vigan10g128200 [Vigna angularis]